MKGRVQFGHAFATNAISGEEVQLVLGSPKASYYPIYVEQEPEGKDGRTIRYNTYSDDGKSISGWKRYPVRAGVWNNKTDDVNLDSKMIPLETGSEFESKIRFHNLRKVEIGALLSALTFHGNQDYYHMIGGAKPYGYGKVKIEVSLNGTSHDLNEYMCAFEEALVEDKNLFNGKIEWHCSAQLKQLYTLSFDFNAAGTDLLKYMEYKNAANKNEFIEEKKPVMGFRNYLERYNKIIHAEHYPESIYEKERGKIQIERAAEKEKLAEEKKNREQERIKALEEAERIEKEKRKEQKAKEAEKGLNLDRFDFSGRDAWKNLVKMVERYTCALQKDNNYPRLVKNHPEGLIPTWEHQKISDA